MGETIDKVFPKMMEFLADSVIVAHNAGFDVGYLKHNAKVLGYEFDYTYIDTLSLAKDLFPNFKKYKLGKIAEELGIKVEVAHRALDDVDTTVKVFNVMIQKLNFSDSFFNFYFFQILYQLFSKNRSKQPFQICIW